MLERTEVKVKTIKKDHVGHNNGGTGRVTTTTFLDDESIQNYNFNNRKFG
jgi:hypothetical protein